MALSKAFFSIEFKGGAQLIDQISDTELAMNELAKAIRNAKKAGDADNYKKLRKEQEDLKKSTSDLKKELRDSVKEFEAQKYPIGSLAQLRQEYSKLTKEISIMTKAQRDSADGLSKIKFAANLKKEIIDIDQSIGNFTSKSKDFIHPVSKSFTVAVKIPETATFTGLEVFIANVGPFQTIE